MEWGSIADWAAAVSAIAAAIAAIVSVRSTNNANNISSASSTQAAVAMYLATMGKWKEARKGGEEDVDYINSLERHAIATLIILVDHCYARKDDRSADTWSLTFGAFPQVQNGSYGSLLARDARTKAAIDAACREKPSA